MAAFSGKPTPRASTIEAIVEAVPIVMQWPWLRFIAPSASWNSFSEISPARNCSLMETLQRSPGWPQLLAHGDDVGPGADLPALVDAAELRTTRDTDGRQVGACGAHQQGGRGLVTAHQQHDPIEWMGADVLFDIHGRQVAVEHRGWAHGDLP